MTHAERITLTKRMSKQTNPGRLAPAAHPLPRMASTTKSDLANRRFSVVEVVGGRTNRMRGTRLVVCENTETTYWVWAARGVTTILKEACRQVEANLSLDAALAKAQRKVSMAPPVGMFAAA